MAQRSTTYNASTNVAQVLVTVTVTGGTAPWQYAIAVRGTVVASGSTSNPVISATVTNNCSISTQSITASVTDSTAQTAGAAASLDRGLCPPPPNVPHAADHIIAPPTLSQASFVDRLRATGSPALGEGNAIYTTLVTAGVNPAFALGTFQAESGSGTKGYAVTTKNWGNILYYSWEADFGAVPYAPGNGYTYAKYPTWLASVRAYAQLLTWYNASGYTTVSSASAHWLGTVEGSARHLTYLNNITAVMSILPYDAGAPVRIFDTRWGTGPTGALVSGKPRTFQVTGRGGVPATALAVTGILTVTGATSAGYVSLGPIATSTPKTSTINFPKGDTRATGVTVILGAGGTLSAVFRGVGGTSTALIFDVTGYFAPDGSFVATMTPTSFAPLNPVRTFDTRWGTGPTGALVSGKPRTFQVTGRGGVPATALAVTGILTVTGATSAGYVSLGPIATSTPKTSTINFPKGDTRATGVTVILGAGGTLSAVFRGVGGTSTALIFDVTGYFAPDGSFVATMTPTSFAPLNPVRTFDTRWGTGPTGALVSGKPRTFQVTGRGGVPATALAVTGILTVTGATSAGYVSLGPIATSTPKTSTINFPKGDTRATGVTVILGAGGTLSAVFRGVGGTSTALIFDVTGYFAP